MIVVSLSLTKFFRIMIERILRQKIEGMIGSEKAVIIMGPRQVGKSTLLHEMFGASQDVLWLNRMYKSCLPMLLLLV